MDNYREQRLKELTDNINNDKYLKLFIEEQRVNLEWERKLRLGLFYKQDKPDEN